MCEDQKEKVLIGEEENRKNDMKGRTNGNLNPLRVMSQEPRE